MDGKGRYMDNIFVERLWRSLKYEEVYLNAYASVAEAKAGIGSWLGFYWTIGFADRLRLRPHPTGTTANYRIDVDEEVYRSDVVTVAPAAIGAGVEIGGVTP